MREIAIKALTSIMPTLMDDHDELRIRLAEVEQQRDAAQEALRKLTGAVYDVHQGFYEWQLREMAGKRGMGDGIAAVSIGKYQSLTCWKRVTKALSVAEAILSAIKTVEKSEGGS